jgi:hypothetical protein
VPCCNVTIQPFAGVAITAIPWIGDRPTITVSYLVNGVWEAIGVATNIRFIGEPGSTELAPGPTIIVDHGGIATGVVKLVQ